jgi:putative ABC transport system substrate-binding protein
LAAALLFGFGPAEAQQPTKLAKIGWLGVRGSGSGSEVFRREFRALGYIEGKNAAILYRYAENRMDRLPALADELIRLKVDVIVTPAMAAAFAAKNATQTTPIVFLMSLTPLVPDLSITWRSRARTLRELLLLRRC